MTYHYEPVVLIAHEKYDTLESAYSLQSLCFFDALFLLD